MSALRRGLLSEPFTGALYACAPWRGCGHACAYCDGRAEKYYVAGDFERDIVERVGLSEQLDVELGRLRERDSRGRRPLLSIGSGVTDAYQPLEAERQLMSRLAALLIRHRQPALVLTKSALVRRDLPLWTDLHQAAGFILLMTVTTTDQAIAARFEPGASPSAERFATLEAFKAAGIPTGVLAMPLLPGLSDGDDAIRDLFCHAANAGVDFVMPGGLTLRPGRQKDHYLAVLDGFAPQLAPLYREIYVEERPSGAPIAQASRVLYARLRAIQAESGLPARLPHAVLHRYIPEYEALHLLFCQMAELYQERGIDTRPLRAAAGRYGEWLRQARSTFNRSRRLEPDWISRQFQAVFASDAWEELLGNPKLAAFSREIVLSGKEFDYQTLKLAH
jgi:DNA repair photolyase